MKLHLILAATLFFCSLVGFGQRDGLLNSGDILEKGVKLSEEKKYKAAIEVFSKISRSDTNYSKALYHLAYNAYADSNFETTKKYALEGLKRFPQESPNWYNFLANAYDETGDHQKALEYYDKMIADDRNNSQGLFNKAITLYRQEKNDEAKKYLQECLLVNPYHGSAHYFLGQIAMEEGRLPEAMMSYVTSLVINPGNRYLTNIINALSGISKMTDDVSKKAMKRKPSKTDNFELVQEIIVNRIAMDKQYKLRTSLEDPIVRQLQVLLEKLEYDPADKGFWMQYYVPFFVKSFGEDQFEPLVYHIFSKLDLKPIASFVSKNEKRLRNFEAFADEYFTEIKSTQVIDSEKRKAVKSKYHYATYLIGKGETRENGKDVLLVGMWELYHANGKIKSRGTYNEKQERTGWWEEYFDNGQLKGRTNYVNGKMEGRSQAWYDNGVLANEGNYHDGDAEGEWKYYYYNGLLSKIANYKGDKLNGPLKAFTANATPYFSATYKDDKETGEVIYYHPNGKVQTSTMYADGEPNGKFRKFYYVGQLEQEGNFEKNKRTGLWKEYYAGGKLYSEMNYLDGELNDESKLFYENGHLQNKATYKKGKAEGKTEDYDEDGKLFCDTYFEKGRLRDIKFYDKSGKVISSATSRNGSATLTFFDPNGNKTSEGYFTKEGLRSGKTTYYYRNGRPSTVAEYKDGLLDGERVTYFPDGRISEKGTYTADVQNGYQVSYHLSGKLGNEGWVLDGSKQGEHIAYNNLGDVVSKANYLNDEENGYVEYYHPNGKLDYEQRFEGGWLKEITEYDTLGNVLSSVFLPQGNGDLEFKLQNGKTFIKGTYKNNRLHGEYKTFYPDGSVNSIRYYKWGYQDSIFKSFYPGGKLESEGKYKLGQKQGVWKTYFLNGQVEELDSLTETGENDISYMYNEDGTLDKKWYNKNNSLHGPYRIYGDNNQLAIQFNYSNGKLVSYTYEGKDGKLVPEIALKNGAGAVTAFYRNGNKSMETNIEEDAQNGSRKLYFSNGKKYIEGDRINGYDHGTKKIYYSNSQVQKEENYWYGALHGTTRSYYPNGKLQTEESYYNGELHGTCKYYDVNGKVELRNYFYGVMQSSK